MKYHIIMQLGSSTIVGKGYKTKLEAWQQVLRLRQIAEENGFPMTYHVERR